MFHFSKFINLFFYVHSHFDRFSQFWNLHAHSILLAYSGSMLYAIPSFLDVYTIDAHSIHFQLCNLIAFPSLLEQCYILMQCYICHLLILILVPFLVSFNVYAAPSFFQLCSLLAFFPHTCYAFNSSLTT